MVTDSALEQLEIIAFNSQLTNIILLVVIAFAAAFLVCSVLWSTVLKHI